MSYELTKKTTILNIFLGSPSDLQKEREMSKDIVDRINKHLARNLNLVIDLRGWEDTLPGYSRPQQKINEDVLSCDLFVGIIYKRWGTPTGKYSSGFEEEFDLAYNRIKAGNLKDIWVFFKKIPEDFLEDPTEQTKKVLDFKKRIESQKDIFYKTFVSEDEWQKLFYDYLSDYISKEIVPKRELPSSSESVSSSGGTRETSISQKPESGKEALINSITGLLESLNKDAVSIDLDDKIKSRLFLLATSLFYDYALSTEMIGIHEIQLLYKNRSQIVPLSIELYLIFRSIISDSYETKVGWFWFKNIEFGLSNLLLKTSQNDISEEVRLNSLEYLKALWGKENLDAIKNSLEDAEKIKIIALEIFEKYGGRQHLEAIKVLLENSSEEVSNSAWCSMFAILLREDPPKALQFMLDSSRHSNALARAMYKYKDKLFENLSLEESKVLLSSNIDVIRYVVFDHLKTKLSLSELRLLTSDKDKSIQIDSFLELLRRNEKVDIDDVKNKLKDDDDKSSITKLLGLFNRDRLFVEMYKNMSFEQLNEKIFWTSIEAPLFYEAIADKYYDSFRDTLLEDIRTGFHRLKAPLDSLKKISLKMRATLSEFDKFDSFTRESFLKHAIKVLSQRAKQEDIEIARSLLFTEYQHYNNDIHSSLLKIFSNFGNQEDALLLRKALKKNYSLKRTAAETALDLDSQNKYGTIEFLLELSEKDMVCLALKFATQNSIEVNEGNVVDMLYNDNDEIRLYSLSYLLYRYDNSKLENLLNDYMLSSTYYYNVVCWIDRILYAPAELNQYFRSKLLSRLNVAN